VQVSKKVREQVAERSEGQCENCYYSLHWSASLHHRTPRGMGGTRRTDINLPSNLLYVCGSGTTGCHGWIESQRTDAMALGLLVPRTSNPVDVPFRDAFGQWWVLDVEGGKTHTEAPPNNTAV